MLYKCKEVNICPRRIHIRFLLNSVTDGSFILAVSLMFWCRICHLDCWMTYMSSAASLESVWMKWRIFWQQTEFGSSVLLILVLCLLRMLSIMASGQHAIAHVVSAKCDVLKEQYFGIMPIETLLDSSCCSNKIGWELLTLSTITFWLMIS